MQGRQVQVGRTFVVVFEHGDDFFLTLEAFCDAERVSSAYLPMFIAGFESVDLKEHSAVGHTSHLLGAKVQFLVEMVVVEVSDPALLRRRSPDLYDVPLLGFQS
jgi:predicted DNA-binding protein with PD1-like motif